MLLAFIDAALFVIVRYIVEVVITCQRTSPAQQLVQCGTGCPSSLKSESFKGNQNGTSRCMGPNQDAVCSSVGFHSLVTFYVHGYICQIVLYCLLDETLRVMAGVSKSRGHQKVISLVSKGILA